MTAADDLGAVTEDGFLDRRLTIRQPARGAHRAGLDAVLLAAAVPSGTRGRIVDLGAGVGVAGLAAGTRSPEAEVVLVEIDPAVAELARVNAGRNRSGTGPEAAVVTADATDQQALAQAGLGLHAASVVISNPPYHPADRVRRSPSERRATAHVLEPDDLLAWMKTAAFLLHPHGLFVVIFRADELPRLLAAIGTRFGSLTVLPIHPRADADASRVIVTGRPQGRAPLRLRPPLILHGADGAWTEHADAILRGGALPG